MINELEQKAFEIFKANCWNGIQLYQQLLTFQGALNDVRIIMSIADGYYCAAQGLSGISTLRNKCNDFFPYIVFRAAHQRASINALPEWIKTIIQNNGDTIPDAIDWIDGTAVVRK